VRFAQFWTRRIHGRYRKVWARLRFQGVRTLKERVNRLMRENQLLSPCRQPSPVPCRPHEGVIVTSEPDRMWGTDATATVTAAEGSVTVFAAIDHCTAECVGIHAVKKASRFEALEPVRQGVRERFGGFFQDIAAVLQLRHDHGSVYMSDDFRRKSGSWESSPLRHSYGNRRATAASSASSERSRNNCSGSATLGISMSFMRP